VRVSKLPSLPEGGRGMLPAGADIEGNCPFEGRVRKIGGSRGVGPPRLSVCFEEALFLLLDLRPPGRGRGDVMGLRPLRSPLPTPRSTPLALAFAWASLWPGQFLKKLTRATSRSAIAITLVLRAEHALSDGLQDVMFPGEVLREHGALSRSRLRKGPGSGTSARLLGRRECGP